MRTKVVLRGLGLLTLEAGAVLILHGIDLPSIDWSRLGTWLDQTHPEDAVIAIVRAIALVGTYYLIATTLLVIVATLTRVPTLVRGVQVVSLPGLRRAIEGVAAVSIVASPLTSAAPAFAQDATPVSATVKAERYVPTPAGDSVDSYEPTPAGDGVALPSGRHHVVVEGESLWSIAKSIVPASAPQRSWAVDRYWRQLIELNIDTLESGIADLIFPGEVLALPDSDSSWNVRNGN